jgi:hypothetical protein
LPVKCLAPGPVGAAGTGHRASTGLCRGRHFPPARCRRPRRKQGEWWNGSTHEHCSNRMRAWVPQAQPQQPPHQTVYLSSAPLYVYQPELNGQHHYRPQGWPPQSHAAHEQQVRQLQPPRQPSILIRIPQFWVACSGFLNMAHHTRPTCHLRSTCRSPGRAPAYVAIELSRIASNR